MQIEIKGMPHQNTSSETLVKSLLLLLLLFSFEECLKKVYAQEPWPINDTYSSGHYAVDLRRKIKVSKYP